MSETTPDFESSIERVNKRVTANIGGRAVLFSYDNTLLYEHYPPFEMFDHIFRMNDRGDSGSYYLRDETSVMWDTLAANGFPRNVQPYPSPQDEKLIIAHHEKNLEKELDAFNGGLDI